MNIFLTKLVSILITPVLLVTNFFGVTPERYQAQNTNLQNTENLGATIPTAIALFQTSLANSITTSATSMTLVSATTKDGTTLASSTYGFIIDEGTASEEFVLANCTATVCSGMTRGISVIYGTSTVTGLAKAHRRGASVKITNAPIDIIMSRILNGQETIPNVLKYNSAPTFVYGNNQLVTWEKSKDYTDTVAIYGAPNMEPDVRGIAKLSVTAASTTNPIVIGDNDPRIPTQEQKDALAGNSPSATNTFLTLLDTATTSTINKIVKVNGSGKINGGFIKSGINGNGVDGNITISTTTTLTSDMYYGNLTVASGTTLLTGGYRIFATGTITVNGIISNNGGNGADGLVNTGGAGGLAASSTTLGISTAGTAGGGGDTGYGNPSAASASLLHSKGGTGGIGAGSSNGVPGTATPSINRLLDIVSGFMQMDFSTSTIFATINSGTGGTGGKSGSHGGDGGSCPADCAGGGGGGGGGGGIIFISTNNIIVSSTGSILAKGGNGGAPGISGGVYGYAGGGGGGGFIYVLYKDSYTNSGTVSVAGGTGASSGSSGNIITLQI